MKRKMKRYAEGSEDAVGFEEVGDIDIEAPNFEALNEKKSSNMTDEERYGKVGAEIRRLDPEAFKNRKDKSAAANMKLLKELRAKKPAKMEVTKTETTVKSDEGSGRRPMPKSKLPEGYRPKVGSGRYDDPTSSFGERVMSPLKRLVSGDVFGQRNVERVARGAGVDTEEARRRLRAAGMKKGGSVSSASKRADGIAQRGKTRGRMI